VVDFGSLGDLTSPPFGSLIGRKVYVAGSWDCFGTGHIEFMKRVKEVVPSDSKLVVGVWSDEVVEEMTGEPPLLTITERALAVTQCKYTDAVLYGVPINISASRLGLDIVVNGDAHGHESPSVQAIEVPVPSLATLTKLRDKIHVHLDAFKERQRRKQQSYLRTARQ